MPRCYRDIRMLVSAIMDLVWSASLGVTKWDARQRSDCSNATVRSLIPIVLACIALVAHWTYSYESARKVSL